MMVRRWMVDVLVVATLNERNTLSKGKWLPYVASSYYTKKNISFDKEQKPHLTFEIQQLKLSNYNILPQEQWMCTNETKLSHLNTKFLIWLCAKTQQKSAENHHKISLKTQHRKVQQCNKIQLQYTTEITCKK